MRSVQLVDVASDDAPDRALQTRRREIARAQRVLQIKSASSESHETLGETREEARNQADSIHSESACLEQIVCH